VSINDTITKLICDIAADPNASHSSATVLALIEEIQATRKQFELMMTLEVHRIQRARERAPRVRRDRPTSVLSSDNMIELPEYVVSRLKVEPNQFVYFVEAGDGKFYMMSEDAMDAFLGAGNPPTEMTK